MAISLSSVINRSVVHVDHCLAAHSQLLTTDNENGVDIEKPATFMWWMMARLYIEGQSEEEKGCFLRKLRLFPG